MDKHASRIAIFNDTLEIIGRGWYVSQGGKRIELPDAVSVMADARMYNQPVSLTGKGAFKTGVRVEEQDCVLAAKDLIDEGYNPAMLNLADLYVPGGLVEYGSGAQEENLCRRSNLVQSLYQFDRRRVRMYPKLGLRLRDEQYPMNERYGGIYSGKVLFFRTSESGGSVLLDESYNIPVISVAALSGPHIGPDGRLTDRDAEITREKMRTIYRIGALHGHDALVLSAFGCGAFHNPPAHIAKLFHEVLLEEEFSGVFKLVEFAILDGYKTGLRHNPEGNFLPFQREFGA